MRLLIRLGKREIKCRVDGREHNRFVFELVQTGVHAARIQPGNENDPLCVGFAKVNEWKTLHDAGDVNFTDACDEKTLDVLLILTLQA